MYEVDGLSEARSFDQGTSLLVTGDTQRSEEVAIDLLAQGTPSQAALLIATNTSAEQLVRAFEERSADTGRVGIVDCTMGEEGGDIQTAARVRYLPSPGDLTGISLEFAKLVQEFEGEVDGIRVGLSTISTVLMYGDAETAFRFLHVFTSRIRSGEMFGVFTFDPEMHDGRAVSTIRSVFEAEAAVGEAGIDLTGSGFQ